MKKGFNKVASLMLASVALFIANSALAQNASPATTDRAPHNLARQAPDQVSQRNAQPLALLGEMAYALDLYPGENLVNFPDVGAPGTWTIAATVPGFYPAGDFLGSEFSKMYAMDATTNELVSIDTATGARTVIGSAVGNGEWSGMTGAVDGTLYVSSSDCGVNSTLYTINPTTADLTLVGQIGFGSCIIDIAINAAGEMYGVDIVSDSLVQINTTTGAGTTVGPLGVDANYAQGLDFEQVSGVLYWAAYTASGEMRIIDTTTGASSLVGAFPGGAEVDALSFATFPGSIWTVTPSAGSNGSITPNTPQTVSGGATTMFTVTPDAGYTASVGGTCGGALAGTTYTTNAITADCTVDATFTMVTHIVTPSAGSNGSITPNTPQTVADGATTTFTVTPLAGYTASVGGTCGGALAGTTYTTNAVTADCTVDATFAVITNIVTPIVVGSNGSITPNTPQSVAYGGIIAYTLTPNTGYEIDTVTGCGGTLVGNVYTTGPITAACTVSASFRLAAAAAGPAQLIPTLNAWMLSLLSLLIGGFALLLWPRRTG